VIAGSSRRWLVLGLIVLSAVLAPRAREGHAAPLTAIDPVFGVATGAIEDEGEMMPTGNGRFTIDDRVYVGKSLGRSVDATAAACFTGDLRSIEDWALESPRLAGSHQSVVTIRSERGSLTLRLRGQMDQLTASGRWEVMRGTGGCAGLGGDGRYTATYSAVRSGPDLRLTFDGEARA
jgi:hypothetical protein